MKNIILLIGAIIILSSCHKEGTGGANSLVGFPKHHGKSINSGIMYIKYGAKESPGADVSKYDAKAELMIEAGEDAHAHFSDLKKGDYYLYFAGYDSSIMEPVFGGIPVELKKKSGETDVDVPVVE